MPTLAGLVPITNRYNTSVRHWNDDGERLFRWPIASMTYSARGPMRCNGPTYLAQKCPRLLGSPRTPRQAQMRERILGGEDGVTLMARVYTQHRR
jgi:hypothetical protein